MTQYSRISEYSYASVRVCVCYSASSVRNRRSVEERPSSDHVYAGLTVPAHELDLYSNASHTATVQENQFEAEAAEH